MRGERKRDIFPHADRSEEHRQADILENLLALLYHHYGVEQLERENLHRVWPYYLRFLEMRGIEVGGFFRDVVTHRYRALDQAIFKLLSYGFIHYRIPDRSDRFYFNFYPRLVHSVREAAEPREWEVAEEALPFIVRLLNWRQVEWDEPDEESEESGERKRISFQEFVTRTLNPA